MERQYSRNVGPGTQGGFVLVLGGVLASIMMMVTLGARTGWWSMCDTVPCASPRVELPTDADREYNCQRDDIATLLRTLPGVPITCKQGQDGPACRHELCTKYQATLDHGRDTRVEKLYSCLYQVKVSKGRYIPFGDLCCSVCAEDDKFDPEAIYLEWSNNKQTCGLFTCSNDHLTSRDVCSERAKHIKAVQAFATMACILMSLTTIFHIFEFMTRTKAVNSRTIPLPREANLVRIFARMHMHYIHFVTAVFLFFAGVLMIATLSRRLCSFTLVHYVTPSRGITFMFYMMAMQVLFGCYYLMSVSGFMGLSKVAYMNAAARDAAAGQHVQRARVTRCEEVPQPVNTTPGPVVRTNSMATDRAQEEQPPVELHAVRMSPKEGSLSGDSDPDGMPAMPSLAGNVAPVAEALAQARAEAAVEAEVQAQAQAETQDQQESPEHRPPALS